MDYFSTQLSQLSQNQTQIQTQIQITSPLQINNNYQVNEQPNQISMLFNEKHPIALLLQQNQQIQNQRKKDQENQALYLQQQQNFQAQMFTFLNNLKN